MNTEILQQVIADQKLMISRKNRGIPRIINSAVHLNSNMITVISGVRRSGKSTLMLQLADEYETFHFITFDDERLINFSVNDFNAMLIEMKRSGESRTIVMDEIQEVPGWERFARRIYDEGYKVIITGSNAKLLSSELATHLTGRYLKIELYPFSFAEFLSFKKIDPLEKTSDTIAKVLSAFDEYLLFGGFPEYLKTKELEILKRIYDDIVYRDLIVRFGIRNVIGFKNLSQYIFTNFTSETGYLPLAKLLGFNSSTSIKDYLNILSEGYLIFELTKFDFSLKRQYTSNRKLYVIDNGLRNTVSFRTSADMGRLLENTVFLELKRRGHEVWFYKSPTGQEVDFLVNPNHPTLIQVCYDLQNPKTRQREISSLSAGMKELNMNKGIILTKNDDEVINDNNLSISVIPVWKWLLSSDEY